MRTESEPDARGRILFAGCARSQPRSVTPLKRCTELAKKMKAAAAIAVCSMVSAEPKATEEISAPKTCTFSIHCLGRQEIAGAAVIPAPQSSQLPRLVHEVKNRNMDNGIGQGEYKSLLDF